MKGNIQKIKKHFKINIIVLVALIALVSFIGIFSSFIDKITKNVLLNFNIVSAENSLLVHYIDVGQGDATAINLPDGKVMLIDTGTTSSYNLINYLNDNVFNTKNNKKLDYLVLTHSHEDHIGGAVNIINNFDVGVVYMPIVEENSIIFNSLKQIIKNKNIQYSINFTNLATKTDSYSIEVFGPLNYNDNNNSCPIIKINSFNYSFLFTGDIEHSIEDKFVEIYGKKLDCDLLKIAHHGSNTSNSIEFLNCVTPDYAIISCGVNNIYDHPNSETLTNLNEIGAKVFRTDLLGNIMFVANSDRDIQAFNDSYIIIAKDFKIIFVVLFVDCVLIFNIVVIVCNTHLKVNKAKKTK